MARTFTRPGRRTRGPASFPPPDEAPARRDVSARILRWLTHKPTHWTQRQCVMNVIVCLLLVGVIDYVTGYRISVVVFYFLPVALAVAWVNARFAVFISIASMGVWLLSNYAAGAPNVLRPEIYWNMSIILSMFLLMTWVLHALISLQRELEERVRSRTAALRLAVATRERLQRELLALSERERSSIGHDLHDGLGQHLTATAYAAQMLAEQLAGRADQAAGSARTIVGLVQEGIAQTRQLARGLLLAVIEPERLTQELEEMATGVRRQHGITCLCETRGDPLAASTTAASHLYHIAQEAVRNALRHARPTLLEISLVADHRHLVLTVTDNGSGLPAARQRGPGMGLRIMAHRASLIGGDLAMENVPGGGTRIRCRVPVSPPAAADGPDA